MINKINEKNDRIIWVDYLKAFACLLVVIGHLIQSFHKSNIDNYVNVTTFINWFIYLFHMPLFMSISGFLYYKWKKEFSWKNYRDFELKKIINLLVPYVIFYLLSIIINMIFASSVNDARGIDDLLRIFNNPIAPYWFLYALLSIFLIIPLLEKLFQNNKLVFAFLLILKIVSIFYSTNIFFIDSIMKWGLYFYIGCFFQEKKIVKPLLNILFTLIYFLICIGIYIIKDETSNYIGLYELIKVLLAFGGIFICVNIFKNINKCMILDSFKKYTFQIFLMHTIFAAGIRIVLLKLNITNYFIHIIAGLIFSTYIPVVISIISNKVLYTNMIFYPIKTIEEIKERKTERCQKKN